MYEAFQHNQRWVDHGRTREVQISRWTFTKKRWGGAPMGKCIFYIWCLMIQVPLTRGRIQCNRFRFLLTIPPSIFNRRLSVISANDKSVHRGNFRKITIGTIASHRSRCVGNSAHSDITCFICSFTLGHWKKKESRKLRMVHFLFSPNTLFDWVAYWVFACSLRPASLLFSWITVWKYVCHE